MSKKVHLVLGSGGARGIAHIAIIEQLEKRGFEIVEVIGCSMGAVIGGIYAAGHLQEYKKWLFSLDRSKVFELMDFTLTRLGFVKGEKIFAKHKEMTGDLSFDDLKIPFTAVATDMKHNEEVLFKSGDLYKALRASVSIPGLYIPVVQDGRVLVDGGVLNPLPINLVEKQDDAIIVAVDLNARADEELAIPQEEPRIPKWFERILPDNLLEYAINHTEKKDKQQEAFSLIELMESTFSFTQDRLTSLIVKVHPPDVLINIPRNACGTFEFYKAAEIHAIGKNVFDRDFNPDS